MYAQETIAVDPRLPLEKLKRNDLRRCIKDLQLPVHPDAPATQMREAIYSSGADVEAMLRRVFGDQMPDHSTPWRPAPPPITSQADTDWMPERSPPAHLAKDQRDTGSAPHHVKEAIGQHPEVDKEFPDYHILPMHKLRTFARTKGVKISRSDSKEAILKKIEAALGDAT